MTVQTLTPARHATRLTLALAAIAGLILATFYVASPAFAGHDGPLVTPTPTGQSTNPDCSDVDGDFVEEKFDPPNSGTQGHVSWVKNNDVASFQTSGGWLVAIAIIKGGNEGANVYDYRGLAGGGVDHDNGLVTPTDQGISHVEFCLVQGPPPPSVPASVPASVPGSVEGSQLGGTGTPAPSLPNTALGLAGSGPLATIFFGAVLIASLGALAYANVAAVRRRR